MIASQQILAKAIQNQVVDSETTAIGITDFDGLTSTIENLVSTFPDNFQHTFAVKANSLRYVLMKIAQCGIGAEVASPGELMMAESAGFAKDKIPSPKQMDLIGMIPSRYGIRSELPILCTL